MFLHFLYAFITISRNLDSWLFQNCYISWRNRFPIFFTLPFQKWNFYIYFLCRETWGQGGGVCLLPLSKSCLQVLPSIDNWFLKVFPSPRELSARHSDNFFLRSTFLNLKHFSIVKN